MMNNSFSQPGKLEELLIGESQIDFSQKNLVGLFLYPLKLHFFFIYLSMREGILTLGNVLSARRLSLYPFCNVLFSGFRAASISPNDSFLRERGPDSNRASHHRCRPELRVYRQGENHYPG